MWLATRAQAESPVARYSPAGVEWLPARPPSQRRLRVCEVVTQWVRDHIGESAEDQLAILDDYLEDWAAGARSAAVLSGIAGRALLCLEAGGLGGSFDTPQRSRVRSLQYEIDQLQNLAKLEEYRLEDVRGRIKKERASLKLREERLREQQKHLRRRALYLIALCGVFEDLSPEQALSRSRALEAARLRESGLSYRQVGDRLGVSASRAHQLAARGFGVAGIEES